MLGRQALILTSTSQMPALKVITGLIDILICPVGEEEEEEETESCRSQTAKKKMVER